MRSLVAPALSVIAQLAFLSEDVARQFARAGGIAFVKRCGALAHGRHPVTVDALRLLSHLARYSPEWYPNLAAARLDVELGALLLERSAARAGAISGGGSSAVDDSIVSVVCNVIGNMCRHANTLHPMLLRAPDGGGSSSSGGAPAAPALLGRVVRLVGSDEARVRRAACIAVGNAAFHYRAEQVRGAMSLFLSHAALAARARARARSPFRPSPRMASSFLFLFFEFDRRAARRCSRCLETRMPSSYCSGCCATATRGFGRTRPGRSPTSPRLRSTPRCCSST